jgi:hypothetical protein
MEVWLSRAGLGLRRYRGSDADGYGSSTANQGHNEKG